MDKPPYAPVKFEPGQIPDAPVTPSSAPLPPTGGSEKNFPSFGEQPFSKQESDQIRQLLSTKLSKEQSLKESL